MSLGLILLIVLIVLLLATVPAYPYSAGWGYGPAGLLSALLLVVFILILLGIIPIGITHDADGGVNIDLPEIQTPDIEIK